MHQNTVALGFWDVRRLVFFGVELAGPCFFFVAGKCCMVSLCHWNRCFLAAFFFGIFSGSDIFVAIFVCNDNDDVLLLLQLPELICFPRSAAVR